MRSTSQKISVVFALVLSASIASLGAFVYWSTAGFMMAQTNTLIETDIEGLAEVYQRRGLNGLIATIEARIARDPDRSSIYLVADSRRKPVVGNISAWPDDPPNTGGWIDFALSERNSSDKTLARTRPFLLRGNVNLLVGRDTRAMLETKRLLVRSLIIGTVFAIVLGLGAGALLTGRLHRRLQSITRTSRDVVRGDLSRRVPDFGKDDDLDDVARSLNAMLDETQRLMLGIQQVTDNIAHDLRTPLARLRNRLVQLHSSRADNEVEREEIEFCIGEVDRLLKSFSGLLKITQLETAASSDHFELIDLEDCARTAIELHEDLVKSADISLRYQMESALVHGDRSLLVQAFSNLLDNAIKFTAPGTVVVVRLHRAHDAVLFSVCDRGHGVAPEDRERVFERMYRGEQARSTQGSGLGLSLVRAIVYAHQGSIALADNTPGLCVELSFPLVIDPHAAAVE